MAEMLLIRAVQRKVVSPERFVFRGCGATAAPPIALIGTPARAEPAEPNEGQLDAPPVAVYACLPAARETLHQTKSPSHGFQNSPISTTLRFRGGCEYLSILLKTRLGIPLRPQAALVEIRGVRNLTAGRDVV